MECECCATRTPMLPAINGNGEDGIDVGENSVVHLGEDSGTNIFESANTTTSTNSGFGIKCTNVSQLGNPLAVSRNQKFSN